MKIYVFRFEQYYQEFINLQYFYTKSIFFSFQILQIILLFNLLFSWNLYLNLHTTISVNIVFPWYIKAQTQTMHIHQFTFFLTKKNSSHAWALQDKLYEHRYAEKRTIISLSHRLSLSTNTFFKRQKGHAALCDIHFVYSPLSLLY